MHASLCSFYPESRGMPPCALYTLNPTAIIEHQPSHQGLAFELFLVPVVPSKQAVHLLRQRPGKRQAWDMHGGLSLGCVYVCVCANGVVCGSIPVTHEMNSSGDAMRTASTAKAQHTMLPAKFYSLKKGDSLSVTKEVAMQTKVKIG
eukprot:127623-Pelagomonas_calceolata.AAC.5